MKLFAVIVATIWLLCGLFGAWWIDEMHLQKIALGPITLVKALNAQPVTYPGP